MKKKMIQLLCLSLILTMTACGAKEEPTNSVAETYSVESAAFVPSPTVVVGRSDDDGPCDMMQIIKVNGKLYAATGEKSTVIGRCGNMDGEITSTIHTMDLPTEDDQSNFGVGYGYQYGPVENTIEVYMNDEWWVFVLMDQ